MGQAACDTCIGGGAAGRVILTCEKMDGTAVTDLVMTQLGPAMRNT